jgi:hypothetical protein
VSYEHSVAFGGQRAEIFIIKGDGTCSYYSVLGAKQKYCATLKIFKDYMKQRKQNLQ